MKFGNYNLSSSNGESPAVKRRSFLQSRLLRVKNTANYIANKVHSCTGRKRNMGQSSSKAPFSPVCESFHSRISPDGCTTLTTKGLIENHTHTNDSATFSTDSSPLSYRASLFGELKEAVTEQNGSEAEMLRFSPRDFPATWFSAGVLPRKPFDQERSALSITNITEQNSDAFHAFGNRAHLFLKNKSISGKRGLFFAKSLTQIPSNPFLSLKRPCAALGNTVRIFGGSCPEININGGGDTLQSRCSKNSYNSYISANKNTKCARSRIAKSKIVQLLEKNENDEKTEMEILQEYFDTMSYSEIVKDRDFRNYLMKKKYLDIMEYIYTGSENGQLSVGTAEGSAALAACDTSSYAESNNDCDSVKKEKLMAEVGPPVPPLPPLRGYYSSNTNTQVFCRRNRSFEEYYKLHDKDLQHSEILQERESASTSFIPCSSYTQKKNANYPISATELKKNVNYPICATELPPYVTLPKKPKITSRCQRTYQQVREFCEKSLMKYTLQRSGNTTDLKIPKIGKIYSQKEYKRVIDDFVRKRGFNTAEDYTRFHYGDFLRKKISNCNKYKHGDIQTSTKKESQMLKIDQYLSCNSLPPPPYSSGDYHAPPTPDSCETKATPPAATNLPPVLDDFIVGPAIASNRIDHFSNPSSWIFSDSFKNFDYVNHTLERTSRERKTSRSTSSACVRLNDRRQIFLAVNSDGEEEQSHRAASPFLPKDFAETFSLSGVIATSDETNRPYIFDDVGVYETITSKTKEMFRAEVRSRKETSIVHQQYVKDWEKHSKTNRRFAPSQTRIDIAMEQRSSSCTNRFCLAESGYRDEMLSEEMSCLVPPGLQGKSDILFGNLHELYTFHNDIFLKDLENCISTTELVALCFVQRRDTFFRLYSYYCQNIPRSERLRETLVDTHLFLQECQKKLGHKLPLAAYLLKPVQRITKYQLLLKDLLKFSDTGTCSRELQKALDCMLVVLKCVNDSMHQIAITGFPADLSQQGELLLQDSFQVWTESKKDLRLRLKTQNRHIFLYQKAMLFCKQGSKTGHNKSTYQFKHWLQMSQIGLTESVRGDLRRFEVWLQGRQEVHTIQAGTIEIKNKWVTEIKRVLLNQLEELKGEKIKQYGLNHKSLRHTASWDLPPTIHNASSHALSGDQQANVGGLVTLSQDVVSRIPHMNEEGIMNATGISSSSSEHDNQEASAWSSDYSNSEDEFTTVEDSVVPGHKFISLADYCAIGNSEVTMKESDVVELLKVGCAGWWFVKVIATGLEGWAPAAYLEPSNKKNSRLRNARSHDKLNDN
ncbi:uncharacterized protein LOC118467126 isoform X2 [Anopheles albimanus]|uniref:uncharacterized protein LOC118467126 isoform X2 n=1 Tax=Anopheles albimanus TaxID=7167 RepID=UPI00163FF777|nr:uncharacterized protein LOC118467126 isoform X2 [Anopheles albimanus]